ncbi:MAG: alpha/beta fold hydrolase [Myxococcales bacterium]|nr:alpha/beta fold hydrolase [Myxococcales bacterium]
MQRGPGPTRPDGPIRRRGPAQRACGAAAFLPMVLVACASLPGAELRDAGTMRQSYALAGDAGPVVVLESGLGNGKGSWAPVFTDLSGFARVLAYDRAGYGRSRSPEATRDAATIVEELRDLLVHLELPPPWVLVGHSIGGQFVELFARTHPEEVAGVVFVDARHVDFSERCQTEQVERCDLPAIARWTLPAAARAELRAAPATEREIRAAAPFPPIPVRVLSAMKRPERMPNLRRVWAESQADLARSSPLARQETCSECGHYLHHDAPERVVEAVRSILREVEAQAASTRTRAGRDEGGGLPVGSPGEEGGTDDMDEWRRLRGLERAQWSDEVRSLLAATEGPVGEMVGDARPQTLNILLQLAHLPKVLGPFLGYASALALEGKLSRRDHELVALRAIWHARSDFEWGHHVAFARVAGLTEAEIARIPSGPAEPAWDEADRLLLEATDALCASQTVDDAIWARLRARLSDAELVELPMLVGTYTMLSMVANATGVPLEPGFPSLPEPAAGR